MLIYQGVMFTLFLHSVDIFWLKKMSISGWEEPSINPCLTAWGDHEPWVRSNSLHQSGLPSYTSR